ncbi:MAG TPA: hypothetical protein VGE97_06815, partial [Nitrososphaera sp.]
MSNTIIYAARPHYLTSQSPFFTLRGTKQRRIRRRAAKKLNPYSTKLSSSASILSLYPYHQVAL